MTITQSIMAALKLWGCLFALTVVFISHACRNTDRMHVKLLVRVEECCALASILGIILHVMQTAGIGTVQTGGIVLFLVLLNIISVCRRMMILINHDLEERYADFDGEYNNLWTYGANVILGLGLVISVVNLFEPIVVCFTEQHLIQQGPGYSFCLVLLTAFFLILIVELISELKHFSMYELYMEILFCFMPLLSVLLEAVLHCESLIGVGFSFGAVVLLVYWQMDQLDENAKIKLEKERELRELVENNTQLLLSQVRPHFLYNSLASIQVLIKKDPNQASAAIKHLTAYLRRNLTSIEKQDLITLSEELEQVEHYVFLENLRYEDSVMINYDIQWDHFKVVPMSILSIVETALASGLEKNPDGILLDIRTFHENGTSVIEVTDGNEGSSVQQCGLELYESVEKTRTRVEALQHGTVEQVDSEEYGRMTVIRIPDPAMQEDMENVQTTNMIVQRGDL